MVEVQVSPPELQSGLRPIPVTTPAITQTIFGIPYHPEEERTRSEFAMRLSALEVEVRRLKKESVGYVRINSLPSKILRGSLDVVVEVDGDGYIARTVDLPLYGHGEDAVDAIGMLKHEIESLYDDLMNGDDFTEDWLKIKRFLAERISD